MDLIQEVCLTLNRQEVCSADFESTEFGSLVRHEMRTAKTGEIDKIGIASRILREKTEDTDDGERVGVKTSKISYATKSVRLPWELQKKLLEKTLKDRLLKKLLQT